MTKAGVTGEGHRRLFWEVCLCFGPTLLWLPTGLIVVPHQIQFVIYDDHLSSLWTVFYFFGVLALVVAVRAMYAFIRDGRTAVPRVIAQMCVLIGAVALAIGPLGTLVLGGRLSLFYATLFVVLPLACLVHLVIKARNYLLPRFDRTQK